jgi:TonB family protein
MPFRIIIIVCAIIVIGCNPKYQLKTSANDKYVAPNRSILITNSYAIDTTVDISGVPNIKSQGKPDNNVRPLIGKCPAPEYPEWERRQGQSGVVYVDFLISPEGKAVEVVITKSDKDVFNYPALYAAIQWQFEPILFNGKPDFYWFSLPLRFSVNKN